MSTAIDPVNDREAWLAERSRSVGASEAAAVLGVCPYSTPIDVWQRKLGLAPPLPESEPMLWGTLLEPIILAEYERRTGRTVFDRQQFVRHKRAPWMTATLDGMAEDRLVEVKTTSAYAREWGDEETDQIPESYLIQVHHQMAVTERDRADVVALIGGQRLRIYEVERNADLVELIEDRVAQFWDCVLRRSPPDWGRMDARTLAVLNPDCEGEIALGHEAAMDLDAYEQAQYEIQRLTKVKTMAAERVLAALGSSQFGVLPDGSRIKRYRQEMPESTHTVKAHVRHYFKRVKGA